MKQTRNSAKTNKRKTQAKGFLAYHIALSLVSISAHPHSGRLLHHRHTSHGVLLVALLFTGILLFNNLGALRTYGLQGSGSTTIAVSIAGDPPTVGANITFPPTNSSTKSPTVQVTGTCASQLLVAVYDNNVFAGSTVCSSDSTYTLVITLQTGLNSLQAQDYDGLNQPGPVTPQVEVTLEATPQPVLSAQPAIAVVAKTPNDFVRKTTDTPTQITPQSITNPCFDTAKINTFDTHIPTIIVSCIQRNIAEGKTFELPVRITGGTPPYTLSVDWGDTSNDLKSVSDTLTHTYPHIYTTAGIIGVSLKTTDAKGATSSLQTVVQINGTTPVTGSSSPFADITSVFRTIWTEAPVPLYISAVTLVLGFWAGDIFQRRHHL